MREAEGVGLGGIDDRPAQGRPRFLREIRRRVKGHHPPGCGMLELEARGVQTKARMRRPAVEGVAENGKALRGGLRPDLMGLAGQRTGLDHRAGRLKPRFRHRRPRVRGTADVSGPDAHQGGAGLELAERHRAISQEEVMFEHAPLLELPGQGAIGGGRLAEEDQPRRFLVQPVQE